MKNSNVPVFILLFGAAILSGFSLNRNPSVDEILGAIPVQSGGRAKPFESFAREALLSVTDKTALAGQGATTVVWKWICNPEEWYTKSFLPVKTPALKQEFSLAVIGGKISPELVLTHPAFQEKVKQALEREERKEHLSFVEKKRLELYEKARLFQAIAQGFLPGFFPLPENPRAGWLPLGALADPARRRDLETQYTASNLLDVESALARLVQEFQRGKGTPEGTAEEFRQSLARLFESRGITLDEEKIRKELLYHRIRPFHWAWMLYLASGLVWFFQRKRLRVAAPVLFGAAFILHTVGFVFRCYLAGRPPVSNMYESIIWVAWGAVLFSIVLGFFYRNTFFAAAASWVAFLAVLIGESFPATLDPGLSPLVPVLRNNYWLTVHVLTITLSYAAFALAWGLAHVNLWKGAVHSKKGADQPLLSVYLYRALQIGVVLLASGTILGGVWANDSWGRFWGWDPKETWALIALLGYLIVLHGRFAGWLGDFGTAVGSILAFLGVLMAWYGVNFVLAAGFHSYGFGGGGLPYVLGGILLDLAFVSFLAFRYNKKIRHASLTTQKR